jgi:hypothetical protein
MPKASGSCVKQAAERIIAAKHRAGKLDNPNTRKQQLAIAYSEGREICKRKHPKR